MLVAGNVHLGVLLLLLLCGVLATRGFLRIKGPECVLQLASDCPVGTALKQEEFQLVLTNKSVEGLLRNARCYVLVVNFDQAALRGWLDCKYLVQVPIGSHRLRLDVFVNIIFRCQ